MLTAAVMAGCGKSSEAVEPATREVEQEAQ